MTATVTLQVRSARQFCSTPTFKQTGVNWNYKSRLCASAFPFRDALDILSAAEYAQREQRATTSDSFVFVSILRCDIRVPNDCGTNFAHPTKEKRLAHTIVGTRHAAWTYKAPCQADEGSMVAKLFKSRSWDKVIPQKAGTVPRPTRYTRDKDYHW